MTDVQTCFVDLESNMAMIFEEFGECCGKEIRCYDYLLLAFKPLQSYSEVCVRVGGVTSLPLIVDV